MDDISRFLLRQAWVAEAGVHLIPVIRRASRDHDRDRLGAAQLRARAAARPGLDGFAARDGRVPFRHVPGGEAPGAPLDEDSPGRQRADRVAARDRFPTGAGGDPAGVPQPAAAQVDDQCREARRIRAPGAGPPGRPWLQSALNAVRPVSGVDVREIPVFVLEPADSGVAAPG